MSDVLDAPTGKANRAGRLRVLAPVRYPWTFNGPRRSRHLVERRVFVPFNYVSPRIEGVTIFNPWPPRRFDLIHAFNRIPIGTRRYVIGFESHLPRAFGWEHTRYFARLVADLASPRCRAIVAISQYARRTFETGIQDSPHAPALLAKLRVRYPSLEIASEPGSCSLAPDEPLRLLFVGNHFARKGGCVALIIAREALRKGIPLKVDIVSALEVGGAIWSDPSRAGFFAPYMALLDLPNVRRHGSLDNATVRSMMRQSHFTLLPTLSDTFGYSVIESMAEGTPSLVTGQGALGEIVTDGVDGITLDLPLSAGGEWRHLAGAERSSISFEATFADEVERLAHSAIARLVELRCHPGQYRLMRHNAHAAALRMFDAQAASDFWDDLYETASSG